MGRVIIVRYSRIYIDSKGLVIFNELNKLFTRSPYLPSPYATRN
jgi:hypothetical protein